MQAAQALLDACQDKNVDLKDHIAALKNEHLSCLYTLYQQQHSLPPITQIKPFSSYEKMMKSSLVPNSTTPKINSQKSRTSDVVYPQSIIVPTSLLPILELDNADLKQSSISSSP